MSLLDNPRETVNVQLYARTKDTAGANTYTPSGDPLPVRGNMYNLSADDQTRFGVQEYDSRSFHTRGPWPGDLHCRVSWGGAEWDQIAPAQHYSSSPNTDHFEIVLRKRG